VRAAIEVKVPLENVNDVTARLLHWRAESGVPVQEGDLIAEMETTKAVFEVHAPASGVLQYSWTKNTEVPVGETLCRIFPDGVPTKAEPVAVPETAAPVAHALFSKSARALIASSGLKESDFAGRAFVVERDVRERLGQPVAKSAPPAAAPAVERVAAPSEEGELVPLERAKLYENRELLAASRAVLKSTLFHLCPAAGLQEACARQTPPVDRLSIILSEAAKLLGQFPTLNAAFCDDAIHRYRQVNIGFAVDMGSGLKVLVVRDAAALGFAEFSARVDDLLLRYSTNSLVVADVTGSTFTVTDLSGDGVFTFDPLLNNNQAAILGIGAEQPGGFLLSCAFDHRINGGRLVAEFLRELSARLAAHARSLGGAREKSCERCFQPASLLRQRGHMLLQSVEPPGFVCSICLSGY